MRWGKWPLAVRAAGVAVVLLAVLGLALLAWSSLQTSGDDAPVLLATTPTPTFTLVLSHDVRSVTPTFVSTPPPPTRAPTPTRTPNPSALATRPCRAEDLVVQMGGSQGAGGNVVLAFFVSNVSADTCRVHG